jgi:hypothetical protein
MKTVYPSLRLLLCVLLLSQTGCAWWRHRHAPAEPVAAVVASSPEATPAKALPATVPAPAAPAPLSEAELKAARTLASDFYQMHMQMSARGLPGAGSSNAYAAFLCPGLASALADAGARQQQFVQAHPQEKPPLVDGDLFTSLFEGADSATALEASAAGDGADVRVALARGQGSEAIRWQDTVRVERDQGIWCVADIAYGGSGEAAREGRLSDRLKAD